MGSTRPSGCGAKPNARHSTSNVQRRAKYGSGPRPGGVVLVHLLVLVLGEPASSSEGIVYGYEYRCAEYANDFPEWTRSWAFDFCYIGKQGREDGGTRELGA